MLVHVSVFCIRGISFGLLMPFNLLIVHAYLSQMKLY